MVSLTETAQRINAHLKRFEADPVINALVGYGSLKTSLYYHAHAYRAGAYAAVKYVSYQHTSKLKRADAEAYLAWLDAGNVGTHYKMARRP